MKLTILGSGTGVPRLMRAASSCLLRINDQTLIIDLGPGVLGRLPAAGSSLNEVNHILITHFHPDHTTDLPAFLFANNYPPYLAKRGLLNLIGPIGLKSFYSNLQTAWGKWIDLPNNLLNIIELAPTANNKILFKHFSIRTAAMNHTASSLAFRIENKDGKSIVFSGDTDYNEELIELAKDANILILECSFPDSIKVDGHLTPKAAGQIAANARVKKLVLTHFYLECDGYDLLSSLSVKFKGEIILAYDLMELEI